MMRKKIKNEDKMNEKDKQEEQIVNEKKKEKKSKKEKKKKSSDRTRMLKWLKFIIVLCIIVIVLEIAFMLIKWWQNENNTVYIDTISTVKPIEDGYIGVGSSDFKYSRYVDYQKEYAKAKLTKYNSNKEVVFETAYTDGYSSTFNDVLETEDYYIAVGCVQNDEQQIEDNATDGLLVVYDKTGNIVDEKTLQIAGDTNLIKIKAIDDGYLVAGQSILQNMVLGNDPNGGGILIKYDKDFNEVWRVNYGGSKSGIFNDFIVDGNAIYVVGKDATRYGIFVKYDLDGNRQFVKNYEYTDLVGFSAIDKIGDDYVVVGGKTDNIDASDADKTTSALLVKYDADGNVIYEKTYSLNGNERYNELLVDDDTIVAVGHTYVKDEEESTDMYNVFRYSGIFARYDSDGNEIKIEEEKGSRDTYFSDVFLTDHGYMVVGQTSSTELGGNNKDLKGYFLEYDKNGKILSYYS